MTPQEKSEGTTFYLLTIFVIILIYKFHGHILGQVPDSWKIQRDMWIAYRPHCIRQKKKYFGTNERQLMSPDLIHYLAGRGALSLLCGLSSSLLSCDGVILSRSGLIPSGSSMAFVGVRRSEFCKYKFLLCITMYYQILVRTDKNISLGSEV